MCGITQISCRKRGPRCPLVTPLNTKGGQHTAVSCKARIQRISLRRIFPRDFRTEDRSLKLFSENGFNAECVEGRRLSDNFRLLSEHFENKYSPDKFEAVRLSDACKFYKTLRNLDASMVRWKYDVLGTFPRFIAKKVLSTFRASSHSMAGLLNRANYRSELFKCFGQFWIKGPMMRCGKSQRKKPMGNVSCASDRAWRNTRTRKHLFEHSPIALGKFLIL